MRHADGRGVQDNSSTSLSELYDELSAADIEHGDVSVTHRETGWCMSAHRDGAVVFQNLSTMSGERYMKPVSKERVIAMWERLIQGDVEGVLKEPWVMGFGP
jgi:hypothetical protein